MGLLGLRVCRGTGGHNFWARRLPGGMGVFYARGRGSKSSFPPLKVRCPWVSREGTWNFRECCRDLLQTRAPWTEVKLPQTTESCLTGVQKVFWAKGPRVSQKSHVSGQTRFAPVQPHVAPVQRPFCSDVRKDLLCPSKALWAASADLTSVPGGLVCKGCPGVAGVS